MRAQAVGRKPSPRPWRSMPAMAPQLLQHWVRPGDTPCSVSQSSRMRITPELCGCVIKVSPGRSAGVSAAGSGTAREDATHSKSALPIRCDAMDARDDGPAITAKSRSP
ncbi:hypothetical protein G6F23_015266 [Rhizopus arrhizus]|nr:hypothetical protein G6F23_015266 [Rhizopus arrhizus]